MNASEASELGERKKTLAPKRSNVLAGYAIACLLVVFSGYNFLAASPESDAKGIVFFSILLLAGAVGTTWYVRRLSKLTVSIHSGGFVVHRGKADTVFAWTKIASVQEVLSKDALKLARGPAARALAKSVAKQTRSYTVVRDDGEKFYFDVNVVPRTSLLAGPIRAAQKQHGFEWETETDF